MCWSVDDLALFRCVVRNVDWGDALLDPGFHGLARGAPRKARVKHDDAQGHYTESGAKADLKGRQVLGNEEHEGQVHDDIEASTKYDIPVPVTVVLRREPIQGAPVHHLQHDNVGNKHVE